MSCNRCCRISASGCSTSIFSGVVTDCSRTFFCPAHRFPSVPPLAGVFNVISGIAGLCACFGVGISMVYFGATQRGATVRNQPYPYRCPGALGTVIPPHLFYFPTVRRRPRSVGKSLRLAHDCSRGRAVAVFDPYLDLRYRRVIRTDQSCRLCFNDMCRLWFDEHDFWHLDLGNGTCILERSLEQQHRLHACIWGQV